MLSVESARDSAQAWFKKHDTYVAYRIGSVPKDVTIYNNVSATGVFIEATHIKVPGASCNTGVGTGTPLGRSQGEIVCR